MRVTGCNKNKMRYINKEWEIMANELEAARKNKPSKETSIMEFIGIEAI